MARILGEMMLADEYVNTYVVRDSSKNKKNENAALYESIFSRYGIQKADFEKSYQFYQSEPLLLKPLFDTLQSLFLRERAVFIDKKQEPPIVVKEDSTAIADSQTIQQRIIKSKTKKKAAPSILPD